MKNKTRPPTSRDDEGEEDDEFPYDDIGDVDWVELTDLLIQIYGDEDEQPDYSLLGSYARDARHERHETRHRRY